MLAATSTMMVQANVWVVVSVAIGTDRARGPGCKDYHRQHPFSDFLPLLQVDQSVSAMSLQTV